MTDQDANITTHVRELFGEKASTWSGKYAPGGRLAGRVPAFLAVLGHYVPSQGEILDLGCGTGELVCAAVATGLRATGCDISPEMLDCAAASDRAGAAEWVQLDSQWQSLPFESQRFDALVAASVMEYVDQPADVLRECHRVLRPGGIVLCTVPDMRHPIRWIEWLLRIATRFSVVRSCLSTFSKLDSYATYLSVSQQRHSLRWWSRAAARASLQTIQHVPDIAGRSPLRMIAFERREYAVE